MPRSKLEYVDLEDIVVSKDDLPSAALQKKQTETPLCDIIRAAGRPGFAGTYF